MTKQRPYRLAPGSLRLLRLALRAAVIVGLAIGAHFAMDWALETAETLPGVIGDRMAFAIVLMAFLAYILLLAVPFVPGAEIGIAILVLRGAEAAPFVYLATIAGLAIAFLCGRALKLTVIRRLLLDLGLVRACALIDQIAPLSEPERLALVAQRVPNWALRSRYLALAVLLNVPGNAVIGGGGGICLLAGFSRLVSPALSLATIALAVLPVPLLVWVSGAEFLR
ncbi:MAG: hypothetical protein AAGF88_13090 [Pseudomonadota bacterium]